MDRNGHLISEILNLQNLSCLLGEGIQFCLNGRYPHTSGFHKLELFTISSFWKMFRDCGAFVY